MKSNGPSAKSRSHASLLTYAQLTDGPKCPTRENTSGAQLFTASLRSLTVFVWTFSRGNWYN